MQTHALRTARFAHWVTDSRNRAFLGGRKLRGRVEGRRGMDSWGWNCVDGSLHAAAVLGGLLDEKRDNLCLSNHVFP